MSDEARANLSAAQRAGGRDKAVAASAQLAAARAAADLSRSVDPRANAQRHAPGPHRFLATDRMLWVPAERVLVDVHRIGPFGHAICGLRIEYGTGERTVQLGLFVTGKQAIALVGQACRRCGFAPVGEV